MVSFDLVFIFLQDLLDPSTTTRHRFPSSKSRTKPLARHRSGSTRSNQGMDQQFVQHPITNTPTVRSGKRRKKIRILNNRVSRYF
ncbi:hypothetical protein L2E82_03655 [Cichorium intybus]|uniref:Uncharacterized protein n=1 Tax=Cichorium intybus TaxID=13427 RepID=A0ACB9H476_CICIN|nr:hypothetical protein L2E82_03655 [Cichorium intybus]